MLTAREVQDLLDACGTGTPAGVRNRALIAVLYRGGLRINEALCLLPKDMDLETGAVRILFGKGGRARTIGLDPGAVQLIEEWIRARASLGFDGSEALFCTMRGLAMTSSYVRVLLPRLARKAGIEKRVHAHGLRHTHAAELRFEGVDIGVISRQLGHTSILTTIRYLDHIAPTAVIDTMRGRTWKR